ncbi:MAG: 16S rRNA (cytosine(1402)-N(4))-methyltransferase RsmH, partial [Alistipes sp.]|nr:16S rRNA (cytosine(1402)-N(4))-methyltransferase RsmH [Alistipes sp.]
MESQTYHIPVMLQECIEYLDIKPDGCYIDLTMGGGGHTREILKHLGPKGHLYSFDQDPDAEANAPQDERHTFVASNFRFLRGAMRLRGVEGVDGILADLGVSSHHFDAKHRGFSFRGDSPLDMRMNTRSKRTAADNVNNYDKERHARIFAEYGELDTTWKIANCIERARNIAPITTTAELVEAVKPCTPPK